MNNEDVIHQAALAVHHAEAMVILTGAGMGVDAGVPDFRGNGGVYADHPASKKLGMSLMELMSPHQISQTPRLCWGVMFSLWKQLSQTTPHEGFEVLRRWSLSRPTFCFTSNVDTMFQKAGFDPERIVECHGSMAHLQSMNPHSNDDPVWPLGELELECDPETMEAIGELPRSPYDGELARPNALLFMDGAWVPSRTRAQYERMRQWYWENQHKRVVLIECGAGNVIPSVRMQSHELLEDFEHVTLIRINPEKLSSPQGTLYLQMGAAKALTLIAKQLETLP